jgi:hypothetical protein
MTGSAALALGIDVFIVFSKKVPGEAKLALAIKDELEQLGLMPAGVRELDLGHWVGRRIQLAGVRRPVGWRRGPRRPPLTLHRLSGGGVHCAAVGRAE